MTHAEGSPEVILLGPVHHARAYATKVGEVLRGVEVRPACRIRPRWRWSEPFAEDAVDEGERAAQVAGLAGCPAS